jgi:MoaA/NifB/PqqE/SkfB family radical SAM enzyme
LVEWSEQNKYNSFNSNKGLTYYEHYKKIIGWLEGKNPLPAPIEASLDPMNACNNRCSYCNSQRYLRENPTELRRWGRDYMEDLMIELAQWGVKAFCWGGGGESTLNIRLPEITHFGVNLGMECSIITNGVHLPDDLLDALMLCRWIGVSLDSAVPEVYQKIRGTDTCKTVLTNIERMVTKRTKTDICVKALLLSETIDNIVFTCNVAKDLGVQDFHVRPVDLERKDFKTPKQLQFDKHKIEDIYQQCHELETKDFHVYTVQHKFTDNFQNKTNDFKCLASPILTQICTDKRHYLCVDHRLEPRFEIKEWGSDQHRDLIKSIDPTKECSRCTFREYNIQVSSIMEDTLCRNFP